MSTASIPIVRPDDLFQPPHAGNSLSRGRRLSYIVVLGALTAFGSLTVDTYLPAFPVIERDLNIAPVEVQLTLAFTMLGFGIGQLLVGPWTDRVGRRRPLILVTALHIVASVGVALAPTIVLLSSFRLLQGFGASASGVVAVAIVRDLFGGKPLVRMLARLSLVNGLAPLLGPIVGSQLLLVTSWRGLFWIIGFFGLIVLLAVAFSIQETLTTEEKLHARARDLFEPYRVLLRDRLFIGAISISAMTAVAIFSYLAVSPYIYQVAFGFSPQLYGVTFAANSVAMIIAIQICSKMLAGRFHPRGILIFSTAALALTGVGITACWLLGLGLWIMIPIWLMLGTCGFLGAVTGVLAILHHGREAGTAASISGSLNFGIGSVVTPFIGTAATSFGIAILASGLVAVFVLWVVMKPRNISHLSE